MRINTFADGAREKSLTFTSNGERTVNLNIPKSAIVKSARLELETHPLVDKRVTRIGIVKNCSLNEFNMLEEHLEATPYGSYTNKSGWGMEICSDGDLSSYTSGLDEAKPDRYAVIPIDPGTMVSANPGYYKREFELVIIPNGPLELDLSNLISSGIPIITMNPALAIELGLGTINTMEAGLNSARVADDNHYITEPITTDLLRFERDPHTVQTMGRSARDLLKNNNHIFVSALECIPENSKVIIDTGIGSQGILIIGMRSKYAYIGFTESSQILETDELFKLFQRTIEWTSIGGQITNLGYDVGAQASGWRKLGVIEGNVVTPDFVKLLNKYIRNPDSLPEPDGSYNVPITFYSDSPGILKITDVRVNCAFLTTITTFADGALTTTLDFDALETHQTVNIELPQNANVLNAHVKIEGNLTNERLANRCIDEREVYGVMASPEYLVAQQFKVERNLHVTRVSLNVAVLDPDTELDLEIWQYNNTSNVDNRAVNEPAIGDTSSTNELVVTAPLPIRELTEKYSWVDIKFNKAILMQGSYYWLVLRTKKGQLNWHADIESPLGGLLRSSRDGGRNWIDHNMDGLFKIYYETETYSPSLSMITGTPASRSTIEPQAPEMEFDSGIVNENDGEHWLGDFAVGLNKYLITHNDPSSELCLVPLTLISESIGTLDLNELEIECEVPTLELRDALEGKTIAAQLRSLLGLLNELQVHMGELIKVIPDDLLSQTIEIKDHTKLLKGKDDNAE